MHTPVLIKEVIELLAPKAGEVYMDATFGAGGYSREILKSSGCTLLAIDRDKSVLPTAKVLKSEFKDRFMFTSGEFANIREVALANNLQEVDGIVFDIGVSSMQIDQKDRGFSFMHDGKLDMRMDQASGLDAGYIVNNYSERDLADIIFKYGDERKSYAIAKAILQARVEAAITTTGQLAKIIRGAVGRYNDKIDPATRTFQALRIVVNDELGQLENGLKQAVEMVKIGGRIVIVTFHSGEDVIVKNYFRKLLGKIPNANRHLPFFENNDEVIAFAPLHKGVITATYEEVERNPRSRSAKLRGIVRIR